MTSGVAVPGRGPTLTQSIGRLLQLGDVLPFAQAAAPERYSGTGRLAQSLLLVQVVQKGGVGAR